MSLRINNNSAAINSHRNLYLNDRAMGKTLEKLSSGMKVNRASDGPATLVISEQMRGQITGMNQAIDNNETAIAMIQTTEANLNEVNRMLNSIRQLAIHASNEGVNDETMLEADQQEVMNALQTIDRIADQAQFGRTKLLDGSKGANASTTGAGLQFVSAGLNTTDSREIGFDVRVTQLASKSQTQGTIALDNEIMAAGEKLTVIENGKMASYTTNADDTVDTAVKNLQSQAITNGLNITITADDSGRLNVEHNEFGKDFGFQVSSTTTGVLSQEGGEIEVSVRGNDIRGTINGESAVGKGQVLTGINGADNVDGLKLRYTGASEGEIPPEGAMVGRVYVTQNSPYFQVGANYGQTVGMSIESINTRVLGRGVDNMSGYKNLNEIDVRTFQGAQDALNMVDEAVNTVASARGEMGAFQKNTLESNLANLRIAQENLVYSESVIRDVDMAKEMATYTRNQIMTQSATAMLAQANQLPMNVLSLLK